MKLITWRKQRNLSQANMAQFLGLAGARTFQRYECGENRADAPLVELIQAKTEGAVTAQDMHEIRLSWLRVNKPNQVAAISSDEVSA